MKKLFLGLLLGAGVIFGYGSALGSLVHGHHHHHGGHWEHSCAAPVAPPAP